MLIRLFVQICNLPKVLLLHRMFDFLSCLHGCWKANFTLFNWFCDATFMFHVIVHLHAKIQTPTITLEHCTKGTASAHPLHVHFLLILIHFVPSSDSLLLCISSSVDPQNNPSLEFTNCHRAPGGKWFFWAKQEPKQFVLNLRSLAIGNPLRCSTWKRLLTLTKAQQSKRMHRVLFPSSLPRSRRSKFCVSLLFWGW